MTREAALEAENARLRAALAQGLPDGQSGPVSAEAPQRADAVLEDSRAALAESEGRLRAILDLVPDLLWCRDASGQATWYNQRWLDYTGQTLEQARGEGWLEVVHPEDRAESLARLREALARGVDFRHEHRLRGRDGHYRWFLVQAMPMRDAGGRILQWYGCVTDIHPQRVVPEALRASERRLQTAQDNLALSVHEVDAEGRSLSIDDTFTRQTGLGMADFAGLTFFDLIEDPADRARAREEFARLVRGEVAVYRERRAYTDRHGRRWWAEGRIAAVRDSEGRFLHGVRVIEDVTERVAAEQALRASEERLRKVLEIRTVGVMFWNEGFGLAEVNDAFLAMTGFSREEALGLTWQQLTPPEFHPVSQRAVEEVMTRGETTPYEKEYYRKDGSRWWGLFAARRLGDEVVEFVLDVTARRQAQEALRQSKERLWESEAALRRLNETLEAQVDARTAELRRALEALHAQTLERAEAEEALRQAQKMEALGQLTGGISHDFNNMLQGISGSLDLIQLRMQQGRPGETGRFLDAARQTVKRAAALTQRLLAFARRQALQPRAVDVDALVRGMVELIQRTVGPAVRVEMQLDNGICPVLCDPHQLENVLLNLAINARDAMPGGGRLTIAARHVHLSAAQLSGQESASPGDYVEIAVSDTGTGMDEVTQARVFEPFFTTKPLGQGTGLGLSQVYGFVRQSHGVVRLESAPEQGTTLRIALPHAAEPCVAPPAMPEAAEAPLARAGAGGRTVLLVEDEPGVREIAAEHLRGLGYEVLEAADGASALRLLRDHAGRLDAMVSDIGLPHGLNGRQLADAVRESRPHLPVLLITGYAGGALEGQLAPGMAVMNKPFSLGALAARLGQMTGEGG